MLSDLRLAARMLRKSPGFTAAAVLALAIGIGASAAIFSVLDAVVYRPLPFPEPSRLARIYQVSDTGEDANWPPADYLDLAAETRAFSPVAAWYDFDSNLATPEGAERVAVAAITQSFFGTLGVRPAIGRDFAPGEDLDGVERMAVVGQGFFRRVLRGDPGAIGRTVTLNGRPVRVIGVLPEGFRFPELPSVDVFVPVRIDADDRRNRGSHYFRTFGRLAPGASLAQAQAELRLILRRIAGRDPSQHAGWSVRAAGLGSELARPVSGPLHLLLGAVVLLLLVACASVAGLLLARGAARQREIAIRLAIGAGRARIVRQLLVEALLLSALGAAVGLCVAPWATQALLAFAPSRLPRLDEVRVDARVAAFGVAVSLASAAIAGLWPALATSRTNLADALKDAAQGTAGASRSRARRTLVVAEIALALVLVVGAGLLLRSFRRALEVPIGFDAGDVLSATVGVPFGRWETGKPYAEFFLRLVERISALPGVTSAAATTLVPMDVSGELGNGIHVEGHPQPPPGHFDQAQLTWVTPGYFRTLRIPLVRGRLFDAREAWRTAPAVVVNEAFVRRYLAGEEPVGARLRIYNGRWDDRADQWSWTIVGVVADAREWGAEHDTRPEIFIDVAQQPSLSMTLVVRTAGNARAAVPALRGALASIDPSLALARVQTLEELLAASFTARRFQALLVSLFGAVALALAALGLYGVVAQSVVQRTREFGVRMALGAQRSDVLAMVVGQGLRLACGGVLGGFAVSLVTTRALQGALFGVSFLDPPTYAAVAALLAAAAGAASWIPARRATRVDPAIALRSE